MSAIGGICNLDGAPVDKEALAALGEGLASRGPDGGLEHISGSIGMVYRAFHTNKESRLEKQPLVTSRGHILCWDGRLDNREELLAQLRESLQGDHIDAAIVMGAYLKWGTGFLPRIIGDFALSLWDPYTSKLLFARDPFGIRTAFYNANEDRIVWSSELSPILNRIEMEVDDEYVAGFLTGFPEPWQTPFKNIQAIPPGTAVIAQNGMVKLQRFWGLKPGFEVRYESDSEYEEHFRALLWESVRCRLRVEGSVAAQLSGGLDSSSIVCIADQIIKSGEAQATRLDTVSYVYDEARTSDERNFIRCVEAQRGRAGHHIREEDAPCLSHSADERFVSGPSFQHCFAARQALQRETTRKNGIRVLLTGHGGDQLLYSSDDPAPLLADWIKRYKPIRLHKSLSAWSRALKEPYIKLFLDAATLLMPRSFQAVFKKRKKIPNWFDKQFVSRLRLGDRMLGPIDVFGFRLPSSKDMASGVLSVIRLLSAAHLQEWGDIEASHPYLHRPLVEFLQAIPIEQKIRPGESRSLLRRALKGVLPEEIANRRSKQGPDEALCRAVTQEWPRLREMFSNAWVCKLGYMEPQALLMALDQARHGNQTQTYMLLMTISLEFWLRSLENERSLANRVVGIREIRNSLPTANAGDEPVTPSPTVPTLTG